MIALNYESLAGWKYRLTADLALVTTIRGISCRTEYVSIWDDGRMILRKGYAWDGPSGPTVDTADSMRGSAGHDALYQLIGLRVIPEELRILADADLRTWCMQDGMSELRANAWYKAVRIFGGLHV